MIPTNYNNSALLDLVGREGGARGGTPSVAVLIGGGPSGENWRDIVNAQGGRDRVVLVTVNGCCQDARLRECTNYSVMLECDPPLPPWQWTPQPGTVVVMNELLMQQNWWGWDVDVALMLQHYLRGEDTMPGNSSCRELVLARRNNGPHGPQPPAGEPWPPAEDDPRAIHHGLHIGPDVGVPGVPPLGTSLVPALHLCFALGCRQVHSVGFDLCGRSVGAGHRPRPDSEAASCTDSANASAASCQGADGAAPLRQHWYEEPRYGEDPRKPKWEWREKLGLTTSEWWYQSAVYAVLLRERWFQEFHAQWIDHSDGLLQAVHREYWEGRLGFYAEHPWLGSREIVREQAARIDWGMLGRGSAAPSEESGVRSQEQSPTPETRHRKPEEATPC